MAKSPSPPVADAPPIDRSQVDPGSVAGSFAAVLYWILVAAVVLSVVGLILAVLGMLFPPVFIAVGMPAVVAVGWKGWAPFRRATRERISGGAMPTLVLVVVLLAASASAGFFSAEIS